MQIINTVKPGYFQSEIQKALIQRKERQSIAERKYIEMNEQMLALITGSHHVSTSTRGKALGLLNVGTSFKRSRAEFEETHVGDTATNSKQARVSTGSSLQTDTSVHGGSSAKRPLPMQQRSKRQ